jgi:hypothetical protein
MKNYIGKTMIDQNEKLCLVVAANDSNFTVVYANNPGNYITLSNDEQSMFRCLPNDYIFNTLYQSGDDEKNVELAAASSLQLEFVNIDLYRYDDFISISKESNYLCRLVNHLGGKDYIAQEALSGLVFLYDEKSYCKLQPGKKYTRIYGFSKLSRNGKCVFVNVTQAE